MNVVSGKIYKDKLLPDRIVDNAGIDAAPEQGRIRCGKMAERAEAQTPPAPVSLINHKTTQRIDKIRPGMRHHGFAGAHRLACPPFSAQLKLIHVHPANRCDKAGAGFNGPACRLPNLRMLPGQPEATAQRKAKLYWVSRVRGLSTDVSRQCRHQCT